jgi:hypothetical protein
LQGIAGVGDGVARFAEGFCIVGEGIEGGDASLVGQFERFVRVDAFGAEFGKGGDKIVE